MTQSKSQRTRAAALTGALCFILTLIGVVFTPAQSAHAVDSIIVDDIVYALDTPAAGQATTTGYFGVGGAVTIPASVTSGSSVYTVTTIGNDAFRGNQLTSVTIPNSVTIIGEYAFRGNMLVSVTIPNSANTIGTGAFANNQLTSVTIPNSANTISDGAFAYNQLTSVTIPDSVTTIGNSAFTDNQLESVTIPDSVTTISSTAFANNRLTTVTIPDSVTTIGNSAFTDNQLESVTIPDSITTISASAFANNQLATVTIPDSITEIAAYAFYSNLLTSVTIPGSVATIGDYAFYINELTSVTIPGSVTTIGNSAFGSNTTLASVRFEGNAPTTFTPASDLFASLGENAEISIQYSCGATGFTTPTWQGYTNVTPNACVVQFDTQGGSILTPESITHGATLKTPTAPTRTGYTFNGWYTDNTGTTAYDFNTPVTSNLTLYAGWTAQQPVIPPTPDTPTPETPAVSPETTHPAPALARTGTTDTTPVAGIALASLIAAAALLITKRRETKNAHTPENN